MKKQKSLFDSVEPKTKLKRKKKIKDSKSVEKESESRLKVEKPEKKNDIPTQTKKILKNEIYTCKCGLKLNWKVAEARKECPQCNLNIEDSDLFDTVEIK